MVIFTYLCLFSDKGYVKMSSAGSVRNLNEPPEDGEIYVEPDLASPVIISPKATPTNPTGSNIKHMKPATLPKPSKLPPPQGPPPVLVVADSRSTSAGSHEVTKGRSASQNEVRKGQSECKKEKYPDSQGEDSQCEDDYESPAMFKEDLKKQRVEVSALLMSCKVQECMLCLFVCCFLMTMQLGVWQ